MCARGGAGTIHLLPGLDRDLLEANPKPLLGYSDITLLHLEMERLGLTSLHGPMVARELAEGDTAYDLRQPVARAHRRGRAVRERAGRPRGAGRGPAARASCAGGCLSLLAAAAGTAWALRSADEPTILFVEDVDEKPYRVDRMLRQLRASGALQGVTGVVFGDMKGCAPGFHEDYRLEEVLLEALEGFDVPVALGLSSGHTAHPNVTLPLGVRARLECRGEEALLRGAGGAGRMKIHLSAICGTAMASLAGLLREQGHEVTGSDQDVYPPMSTQLEALGIPIRSPYAEANVPADADLVVIGNALSRGNPEVEAVLDRRQRFTSLPGAPGRGVPAAAHARWWWRARTARRRPRACSPSCCTGPGSTRPS